MVSPLRLPIVWNLFQPRRVVANLASKSFSLKDIQENVNFSKLMSCFYWLTSKIFPLQFPWSTPRKLLEDTGIENNLVFLSEKVPLMSEQIIIFFLVLKCGAHSLAQGQAGSCTSRLSTDWGISVAVLCRVSAWTRR